MTYSFGYASNSYFKGRDGVVTRDADGATITINVRDGQMAVEVKDHSGVYALPEDVRALANELGEDKTYALYHQACDGFWRDADWLCGNDPGASDPEAPEWAEGIHSSGRSGGWCVVEGTRDLADNFPSGEPPDPDEVPCYYCGVKRSEHDDDGGHLFDPDKDWYKVRDEFLALAFDIVGCIEGAREWLCELIREEHEELEARRVANTVLSIN